MLAPFILTGPTAIVPGSSLIECCELAAIEWRLTCPIDLRPCVCAISWPIDSFDYDIVSDIFVIFLYNKGIKLNQILLVPKAQGAAGRES